MEAHVKDGVGLPELVVDAGGSGGRARLCHVPRGAAIWRQARGNSGHQQAAQTAAGMREGLEVALPQAGTIRRLLI
jgi:hypothetical protein